MSRPKVLSSNPLPFSVMGSGDCIFNINYGSNGQDILIFLLTQSKLHSRDFIETKKSLLLI
ncbi:MAG: hypothetical protein H6Q70_1841 [Firmicutes bacterium]|nr:hypothetical protein [Bacillota bacterium]